MEANKFKHFFLCALLTFSQYLSAQVPEQDCNGAIQELTITDFIPPYVGYGQIQEVMSPLNTTCLTLGEQNSVWIRFSVCENDTLEFLITPYAPATDFDWALYDITGKTCEEAIDSTYEVRCNFSAIPGPTGLEFPYAITSSPAGGPNKCAALSCFIGQSLVLVVNNFGVDSAGFVFSFTGNVIPCLFNGMGKDYEHERIKVYPNPTEGSFELKNLPLKQNLRLKIFDETGCIRFEENVSGSFTREITLPTFLPEGFYFLRISNDEKDFGVSKIVLLR